MWFHCQDVPAQAELIPSEGHQDSGWPGREEKAAMGTRDFSRGWRCPVSGYLGWGGDYAAAHDCHV